MEITKKLAEFITLTRFDDFSEEVKNEAKLCFLDWLGVALAGSNDNEVNSLFEVIELVGGKEQATILGKNIKTSVLNATLLNGMSSHVLDFDDTSVEFLGHPSVTIFPCLLALSEWKEKSGREFLTAFIIGYEIGCRVALGATANHYLKGWHGTSTIGHFSSTAGSAKLLNLNTEQIVHALGIAGTQAAGIKAVFGTSCKPFHAGKASFNGLLSALLAKRGFSSVNNILEGEKCFWDVFSSSCVPRKALKDLGRKWHILKNQYKFHASCHATHAPIEGALKIKKKNNIDPVKIDKIEIHAASPTLEIAGKRKPRSGLEGKFSIPYAVASALLREDTGLAVFSDEMVNDPQVIKLRDKIEMIPDEKVPLFKTEIIFYVGNQKFQEILNILQISLDFDEKKKKIHKKFTSISNSFLNNEKIKEIVSRIENLEQEKNMIDLINLLI